MKIWKMVLIFASAVLIIIFSMISCSLMDEASDYRDSETIEIPDIVFYPEKGISIPLTVKRDAISSEYFKIKEDIATLSGHLAGSLSPRVFIKEETEEYLVIEAYDHEGRVSGAMIEEVTGHGSFWGWHYYRIDGFDRGVGSEELKYGGRIYWPRQFFPLHSGDMTLYSGEVLETEATIDDFKAFYREVSERHGLVLERQGNAITLSKEFFRAYSENEVSAVLTFEDGTVRFDLVE